MHRFLAVESVYLDSCHRLSPSAAYLHVQYPMRGDLSVDNEILVVTSSILRFAVPIEVLVCVRVRGEGGRERERFNASAYIFFYERRLHL